MLGGCTPRSREAVGRAPLGALWQEQEQARGLGCGMRRHSPSPTPTGPSDDGQEALMSSPSGCNHPASVSSTFIQRTSSKPVYTGRRKEMTAHNLHADSLSFQSSSLKPGERGGVPLVEKEQKQLGLSCGLRWWQSGAGSGTRLQRSKRGAAAPSSGRTERRTRLLGPLEGTPHREQESGSQGTRQCQAGEPGGPLWAALLQLLHLRTSWRGDRSTDPSPRAPSSTNLELWTYHIGSLQY